MGVSRRAPARTWTIAAAVTVALAAPGSAPASPRLESTSAGVRWHAAALAGRGAGARAPVVAWWRAARDSGLAGTAVLVPLADTIAARGDTLKADSLLALPRLARSLWAWDAVRRRAAWASGHGDATRAARLLDAADKRDWPGSDEASWRAMLAPLRVAAHDTLGGEALARQVLEQSVSVAPASGQALRLLEALARARGESFAPRLARRAALAEWANGDRARALARLSGVIAAAPETERGADALLRVQWLREWRRYSAAVAASDSAIQWSTGTPDYDRARLERARCLRAAGNSEAAMVLYARVGGSADDMAARALAWWEYAREAQDESRWALAARGFRIADSLAAAAPAARSSIQSAGALAGLMEWTLRNESAAIAAWRRSGDRRARFWLGVALRQRGEPEGERILREEFARRPGFDLYAVAARDTLGLPSWPGEVWLAQDDAIEPQIVAAVVALAGPLGLPDAAARVVAARDHGDPRLPAPKRGIAPSSWRAIAAASYAAGDLAGATRAADRALTAAPGDTSTWSWVPWAFPPAFEAELNAASARMGVERALLWGLVRQESRFDPRAVSRSNALGLAQLLPGTAREVARALGERLPSDTLLFEPARALRYGAWYLRRLLERFEGVAPVALTAYNAGPGRVRPDWRVLIARGGWALYCEMAANADTQDYVRRILGYRQAYRDLRPSTADGP
jgi:soluble lytic murein transglycosylase-like protein